MTELSGRQREIVHLSLKIIANRGIQNLTIKNIAAEVGVTEAAIYRHFVSKFDILMAILEYFAEITATIATAFDQNAPCLVRIGLFVDRLYIRLVESPDLARVIFSESIFQNDDRLAQKVVSIMHSHRQRLVDCLEQGQASGEIRSDIAARDLFRLIIGPTRLTIIQWHLSGYDFDLLIEGRRLWQGIVKVIQVF